MRRASRQAWRIIPLLPILFIAVACATRIPGTATTLAGNDVIHSYTSPADGTGFSTKPMDQLQPLPAFNSQDPVGSCQWLADWQGQLAALGVSHTEPTGSGCRFFLANDEQAQVHLSGPYTDIEQETTFLKPVTIAGLDGRDFSFTDENQDTSCSATINTRSLYAITVDGFNKAFQGGNQSAHCDLANRFAEAIAKKYVPLAGGTPWPGTVQQPDKLHLIGLGPCDLIPAPTLIYANGLHDDNPKTLNTAQGRTCDYRGKPGTVEVLLTSSTSGLSALPIHDAMAQVTATKIGVLPARIEQSSMACTVAVTLSSGQVLATTFTPAGGDPLGSSCLTAQVITAAGVMDTVER